MFFFWKLNTYRTALAYSFSPEYISYTKLVGNKVICVLQHYWVGLDWVVYFKNRFDCPWYCLNFLSKRSSRSTLLMILSTTFINCMTLMIIFSWPFTFLPFEIDLGRVRSKINHSLDSLDKIDNIHVPNPCNFLPVDSTS